MSPKKRLDDIDDITEKPKTNEDETEVQEESAISVPQHKGAKGELRRQQEVISEMTGEPVRPPFSRKEVVGGTRRKIRELPNYQTGRTATKKNSPKPDRPKHKL